LVTKILQLHIENESFTESLRKSLEKNGDFSLHDAFSVMDLNNDGYITKNEMQTAFERNKFFATA